MASIWYTDLDIASCSYRLECTLLYKFPACFSVNFLKFPLFLCVDCYEELAWQGQQCQHCWRIQFALDDMFLDIYATIFSLPKLLRICRPDVACLPYTATFSRWLYVKLNGLSYKNIHFLLHPISSINTADMPLRTAVQTRKLEKYSNLSFRSSYIYSSTPTNLLRYITIYR